MMETIAENIGLIKNAEKLLGDTVTVHETDTNIYQMCFLINDQETNESELNIIGYYLSGEKVYGSCVVINSKIKEDYTCTPDLINCNVLVQILYGKFIHKGIVVNDNGDITEYDYFSHPLEYLTNDINEYNKYKSLDVEFMGFNLSIHYEMNQPKEAKVNAVATRIAGTCKISGKAIIIAKTVHEYIDLSKKLFNKIDKLAFGPLFKRKLSEEETQEGSKINNLPIAINKYCIIEKRFKSYKNTCNYCNKKFDDNKMSICTGCYRAKYHKDCRLSDWDFHKKECLYNKNPINL